MLINIITELCPMALPKYKDAFRNHGNLLAEYGVDNPLRVAHFLAQVLHETGGLTVERENMRYTKPGRIMEIFGVGKHSAKVTEEEAFALAGDAKALAERVYGLGNPRKAAELGNTKPGDGFAYRGGGILQTTGRAAYRKWGELMGIGLEALPELIVDQRYALVPALMEWQNGGCSALANAGDLDRITKKINGGYNGLADRRAWLKRIMECDAYVHLV